ncbi:Hypothetical predicted protein [Podarcis lilfordi]|uniref:Uncharacterized protein n=1 Tax=Podarcis lilfordi TaxID=74358 RepID=A0AA35KBY8_9SAUR|nr:Hypothetical predicted protein [Podarcis lilfordi]
MGAARRWERASQSSGDEFEFVSQLEVARQERWEEQTGTPRSPSIRARLRSCARRERPPPCPLPPSANQMGIRAVRACKDGSTGVAAFTHLGALLAPRPTPPPLLLAAAQSSRTRASHSVSLPPAAAFVTAPKSRHLNASRPAVDAGPPRTSAQRLGLASYELLPAGTKA